MKLYYFMYPEHKNEYVKVEESEDNVVGLEPADNATKEAIQGLYRFNVNARVHQKHYDEKDISNQMIEMFKNSKCYQAKTEEERQEIIQYLIDNPEPDNPFIDY